MRYIISIFLISIIAEISSAHIILNSFDTQVPTVFDARAHALGKSEIMGAKGSNSIFSNPAHVAMIDKGMIQVGGSAWKGELESTHWDMEELSNYDGSNVNKYVKQIPQFSICGTLLKRKDNSISIGVGINKFWDWSEKRIDKQSIIITDSELLLLDDVTNTTITGGLTFLTSSYAINIKDRLKIGFSYNFSVFSEPEYSINKTEKTIYVDRTRIEQFNTQYDQKLKASYFSMGALYSITEKLNFGFMYKSKMNVEVEYTKWSRTEIDE